MTFDDAVRRLARRKGFDVSDAEPVYAGINQETVALSDVTFGDELHTVEVWCGGFSLALNDSTYGPAGSPLARLFDALMEDEQP